MFGHTVKFQICLIRLSSFAGQFAGDIFTTQEQLSHFTGDMDGILISLGVLEKNEVVIFAGVEILPLCDICSTDRAFSNWRQIVSKWQFEGVLCFAGFLVFRDIDVCGVFLAGLFADNILDEQGLFRVAKAFDNLCRHLLDSESGKVFVIRFQIVTPHRLAQEKARGVSTISPPQIGQTQIFLASVDV